MQFAASYVMKQIFHLLVNKSLIRVDTHSTVSVDPADTPSKPRIGAIALRKNR